MLLIRHGWLAAGALAAACQPALADTASASAGSTFDLGVVEITGRADAAAPAYPLVERITGEALRRHERHDVTEAMNLLPGVMIENVGSRNERVVFIRGFDSRQVPLYVDGIPVYVPYSGSIDLARFTSFDLAEIQVTKGFTSVLYGPNTLGGSINLVSRRPTRALEVDVLAGAGFDDGWRHDSRRLAVNLGTRQGRWYLQAGASLLDRDSFSVSGDYAPGGAEDGGRRDNSDIRDRKLSLKLGFTPEAGDEYAISYYRQDGEKGTPPYAGAYDLRARFWRWPVYDKESLYVLSRTRFAGGSYLRLRAYVDKYVNLLRSFDDDSYTTQNRPYAFDSLYDDHTWGGGAEWGMDIAPGHLLKLAASIKRDFHEEEDDADEPREKFEDETVSLAIEDTWTPDDATQVIAGLSWNHQKSLRADQKLADGTLAPFPTGSDDAVNLQLGWFRQLDRATRIHATAGRKTRFPNISNRFSGRLGSSLPNPDLKAEESTNLEIGADGDLGQLKLGGAVFLSRLSEAIQSVSIDDSLCAQPPCTQTQNIERQDNKGIELYLDAALGAAADLHLDYTWLDRKNRTRPEIKPIDTPEHKAFASLVYRVAPAVELVASVVYESSRLSESPGERGVGAFTVANLKGSWKLPDGLVAEFGVDNLMDRDWGYDEGYPEPGRHYFLNLRYVYGR